MTRISRPRPLSAAAATEPAMPPPAMTTSTRSAIARPRERQREGREIAHVERIFEHRRPEEDAVHLLARPAAIGTLPRHQPGNAARDRRPAGGKDGVESEHRPTRRADQ